MLLKNNNYEHSKINSSGQALGVALKGREKK